MRCPYCKNADSRVLDSREVEDGQVIRRRRSCSECSRRFTTVEEATLAVIKRSGVTEPFLRGKVIAGVRRACQGRPVDEDALAKLAQDVEDVVRASGVAEIPSDEVGLAILGPLRELDEVAFLRFASVYQSFDSVTDFEAAIADLRNHQSSRSTERSPGVSTTPPATPPPATPPPATPPTDAQHDRRTSDTSGSGQPGSPSPAPAADAVPATV